MQKKTEVDFLKSGTVREKNNRNGLDQNGQNVSVQGFAMLCRYNGIFRTAESFHKEFNLFSEEVTLSKLREIAESIGLKATCKKMTVESIVKSPLVLPAMGRDKSGNHFVINGIKKDPEGKLMIIIFDPRLEKQYAPLSIPEFKNYWTGEILLVKTNSQDSGASDYSQSFSFTWLLKTLFQQKGIWSEIFICSLIINVAAFITSFFVMLVLDKVIGYGNRNTLHVLFSVALGTLGIQAMLGYLRTLLVLHSVGRIDVKIMEFMTKRMMALPLDFFLKARAGKLNKVVQGSSSVREFMTGNLMFTLFDSTSLIIILPILFYMSPTLSYLVLIFSFLMMLNIGLVILPYRKYLNQLYKVESECQALMVENLHGMSTIKSLAIEKRQQEELLERTAKSINQQKKVKKLTSFSGEISGFLQKAMGMSIIWSGAQMVLDSQMTVGVLVGFNILAGRISGPLVQLVKLASDYQQTNISIKMLGNMLNRPPETLKKGGITPDIKGKVVLSNVHFSYQPEKPILKDINFVIHPGEKIGVVGGSGSGKSTLAKLIQNLYRPNRGTIYIDGYPVSMYDNSFLRSRLGVVSQDNFIFQGSVRENIAKTNPGIPDHEIIRIAKLAMAHEFIEKLPSGYDTILEENASNLSGGQRQRICLARALVINPSILIFDEATSSLDPESEGLILQNLNSICSGRTLINISHSFTCMKPMDRLIVIDSGTVVGFDHHVNLLNNCPSYQRLWKKQISVNQTESLSNNNKGYYVKNQIISKI